MERSWTSSLPTALIMRVTFPRASPDPMTWQQLPGLSPSTGTCSKNGGIFGESFSWRLPKWRRTVQAVPWTSFLKDNAWVLWILFLITKANNFNFTFCSVEGQTRDLPTRGESKWGGWESIFYDLSCLEVKESKLNIF